MKIILTVVIVSLWMLLQYFWLRQEDYDCRYYFQLYRHNDVIIITIIFVLLIALINIVLN